LRPYDLINRILVRHNGRENLLSRLGHEAEDGIDALLSQALGYEQSNVPSLTGFLTWLQTEDVTVKRQMDSAGDRIRVMTVHGAKGLEAPIVILPDTGKRDRKLRGELMKGDGQVFWQPKANAMPESLLQVKEDLLIAQDRERRRLLYVAMTRAENWLIVAAAGDTGEDNASWHSTINAAMGHVDSIEYDAGFGLIKRFYRHDWTAGELVDVEAALQQIEVQPTFGETLPTAIERPTTRSPSELGGAKIMTGETHTDASDLALAWGRIIHLLLEVLPKSDPAEWRAMAEALVSNHSDSGLVPNHVDLISEALNLLALPDLNWMFSTGLAEVPISANLPSLKDDRIYGIIDRLVITKDEVIAVDYKSNRITPETPDQTPSGLVRQMAAYRDALRRVYPNRNIRSLILWTRTGKLTELSDSALTAALKDVSTA